MRLKSVLDLVKHLVFQLGRDGTLVAVNAKARELLDRLPGGQPPLALLFGHVSVDALFVRSERGERLLTEFELGGERIQLRWELVALPASPDVLVAITTEWEPIQDMLNKVQRESLMFRELVLNTLPHQVADALIKNKAVRPKAYRSCTVLFTDVVSFSRLAVHLDPVSLIRKLNVYFSLYDDLVEELGLEKIKTIGDAYMCAGGLPNKKATHAVDCALAALAILRRTREQREEPNTIDGLDLNNWQIRVGLHSGPCISGVVGSKKYVFDIWGDTVNIAGRMEGASDPGRINISAATRAELADFFDCAHRGSQDIRNIGDVEMYFLDRLKAEYSEDEAGTTPNDAFCAAYCDRFGVGPNTRDLDTYPRQIQAFVSAKAALELEG